MSTPAVEADAAAVEGATGAKAGCTLGFCSCGTLSLKEFQIRMRPETSPAAIFSSVGSKATHCIQAKCYASHCHV